MKIYILQIILIAVFYQTARAENYYKVLTGVTFGANFIQSYLNKSINAKSEALCLVACNLDINCFSVAYTRSSSVALNCRMFTHGLDVAYSSSVLTAVGESVHLKKFSLFNEKCNRIQCKANAGLTCSSVTQTCQCKIATHYWDSLKNICHETCPDGGTLSNGKYCSYTNIDIYDNAKIFCESRNMKMIEINSLAEFNLIKGLYGWVGLKYISNNWYWNSGAVLNTNAYWAKWNNGNIPPFSISTNPSYKCVIIEPNDGICNHDCSTLKARILCEIN